MEKTPRKVYHESAANPDNLQPVSIYFRICKMPRYTDKLFETEYARSFSSLWDGKNSGRLLLTLAGLADGQATLHRLIKAKDGVTEAGSDLDVFCLYLRPKVMLPKIGLEVLGYRSVPDYDASERLVE